jgi:hypothetical protein
MSSSVQVVDEARRALNAVRRMREQAKVATPVDRREDVDGLLREDERLAVRAIERLAALVQQSLGVTRVDA